MPYVVVRTDGDDTIDPRVQRVGFWYYHDGNNVATSTWISEDFYMPDYNRAEPGWEYTELDLSQIPPSVAKPYYLEHLIELGGFRDPATYVG